MALLLKVRMVYVKHLDHCLNDGSPSHLRQSLDFGAVLNRYGGSIAGPGPPASAIFSRSRTVRSRSFFLKGKSPGFFFRRVEKVLRRC
ncbi:MAG: hypothetical protein CM1200mP34_3790 [Verrucomicrobiales bacterium]|nr:MAG: hypothetical protein CM1200mP34_3790 [Verrucomicrobiales bacterium]